MNLELKDIASFLYLLGKGITRPKGPVLPNYS